MMMSLPGSAAGWHAGAANRLLQNQRRSTRFRQLLNACSIF
jgi:hypothetical protein